MTMTVISRLAACLAVLMSTSTAASELDLALLPSTAPIGFAAPDRPSGVTLPAGDYDRNGLDTRHDGNGFDVSGSVTTGIGYTQGYGSSTSSSAHLRVTHADDQDDDARPSRFTLDIDVGTARGPGFIAPYGYGGGYGAGDDGYGGVNAFRADESRIERDASGFHGRR